MVKVFISYTTSEDLSFFHIKESIIKNYNLAKVIQARFGIEEEDLISDCWLSIWKNKDTRRVDYILHRESYSNILVSSYLQNRQVRKTTSVAVYYFLKEVYNSEKEKKLVRLDQSIKMEESIKDMLKNSAPKSPDYNLNGEEGPRWNYVEKTLCALSEAGLKPEHMVLLNWQIGIIHEDEAMRLLGVSRKTLFNRWNKVKPEIIKVYYKPEPRKSSKNNDIAKELDTILPE